MDFKREFKGKIMDTKDAFYIILAAIDGRIRTLNRRLTDEEKESIQEGDIFVFSSITFLFYFLPHHYWHGAEIIGSFLSGYGGFTE